MEGRVAVVGAGVIGLTTAIKALQAGCQVTVYSDRAVLATTSTKAAASFKPAHIKYDETVNSLLAPTWREYERILATDPARSGVRKHIHWEAFDEPAPPPPYLWVMEDVAAVRDGSAPGGFPFAWRYRTFFIDTPIYLRWLLARFEELGGQIALRQEPFRSLDEVASLPADAIFNCSGLGARELCSDEAMVPVRGQIAVVDALPDIDWSIGAGSLYIYPRSADTILGGTSEHHADDEATDEATIRSILEGTRRILPALEDAALLRTYAGLRPYRATGIRLERESIRGKPVIHNYGHGGSGFTLCWGSAIRAVELLGRG